MFWPLGSQHLPFDRAQTSGLVFRKLFLTDCKRRGVDLEAKLGLSGRERDFLLRCFVFKLRTESERNEARGRKRAFVKNRSNYTLPAPSATQAESTPKIKYTLHLGTILVTRTHSTRIKCGLWDFIVGSWVFCFFLLHSKVAANQTDGGDFQLSARVWIHFEFKVCYTHTESMHERHTAVEMPSVQTVFGAREVLQK